MTEAKEAAVVSSNVVLSVFPAALSIFEYACQVTDRESVCRILDHEDNPLRFVELCHNSLVVPDTNPPKNIAIPIRATQRNPSAAAVQAIISRLITQSIRSKASYFDQNCLALGYRAKGDHTNAGIRGNMDVECYFVNTIHALLSTTSWQLLALRLGDEFLLHLLTRPVFVSANNGCFVQVAGTGAAQLLNQSASSSSSKERSFFYRRREVRAYITPVFKRHKVDNQGKPARTEFMTNLIEDVRVRGSTQLPRFDVFYKYQYRKLERFLSDTESGESLRMEAFGLLSSFLPEDENSAVWLVHSTSPELPVIMRVLEQPLIAAINHFRRLDVAEVLKKHCPKTSHKRENEAHAGGQNVPHVEIAGFNKVRRGCRAGASFKKKKDKWNSKALLCTSDAEQFPPLVSEDAYARNNANDNSCSNFRHSAVNPKQVSVGQRVFGRIIRQTKQGMFHENEGYASQEHALDAKDVSVKSEFEDESLQLMQGYGCASLASSTDISSASDDHTVLMSASTQNSGCAHHIARGHATQMSSESSTKSIIGVPRGNDLTKNGRAPDIVTSPTTNAATTVDASYTSSQQRTANVILDRITSARKGTGSNDDSENVEKNKKVDYIDMQTPERYVNEFVKSVLRRCFTVDEVWGSRFNQSVMLANVDTYIHLGRNETSTISQMCHKIRAAEMPWILAVSKACKRTQKCEDTHNSTCRKRKKFPSETDTLVVNIQQNILYAFVYWIFAEFIHPLLSTYFYATEAEGCGNQVLWYRKSEWKYIVRAGLRQVTSQFVKIEPWATQMQANLHLQQEVNPHGGALSKNSARVRFLPKRLSVRAITNLRAKPRGFGKPLTSTLPSFAAQDANKLTNNSLYNCLHVLKRLLALNPALMGFGTFGFDEIYSRLCHFKNRLETLTISSKKSAEQKYYVAVLDLEKCYDNVDTMQLFNLVRDLLDNHDKADDVGGDNDFDIDSDGDGFVLHRYSVVHRIASMERVVTKGVRYVSTEGDIFPFEEAATEISQHYRNSIIADGVIYPKLTRKELLRVLRLHLFSHVVKMPDVPNFLSSRKASTCTPVARKTGFKRSSIDTNQYTQVKGIPQGSVLSPILCNLYYGHAERQIFGSKEEKKLIGLHDETLVLRMMDDYIVVSTDKEAVSHFLQRAHLALKPFGGGVNPLKTRVNFDVDIELDGKRIPLQRILSQDMPWCGLLVDTVSLEIKPCMKRVLDRPLRLSTSVECLQPGLALRRAMKSFVRMKCHAIVLDDALNSYTTVYRTIYGLFLVAAMRTHVFMASMQAFNPEKNSEYIIRCIVEAVLFGARLTHSRTSEKVNRDLRLGVYNDDSSIICDTEDCTTPNHTSNSAPPSSEVVGCLIDPTLFFKRNRTESCSVSHRQAVWLGFCAFREVLSKRNAQYCKIVHVLKSKTNVLERILKNEEGYLGSEPIKQCNSVLETSNWL